MGTPPPYIADNSTATTTKVDGASVTPWCVPTSEAQDMVYARKLISAAKEGILFLFFNPGAFQPASTPAKWTLLQNILTRHHPDASDYDPHLYIRGVVNQDIADLTNSGTGAKPASNKAGGRAAVPIATLDPTTPSPVSLFTGGDKPPQPLGHERARPRGDQGQVR